ncbi:hypothetical protein ZEAMMB73_Zm00001d006681 [Zea mays]|jgi:hypothetical protein|uniref:Uncharacterized protein n=1 Tax=Zea mays TaxID=4577 RepID=A0A1D6EZL9_MAIZE|nr:hypothetical protein ZEAMMB73_Zm00001d006681 [Zea mays]
MFVSFPKETSPFIDRVDYPFGEVHGEHKIDWDRGKNNLNHHKTTNSAMSVAFHPGNLSATLSIKGSNSALVGFRIERGSSK